MRTFTGREAMLLYSGHKRVHCMQCICVTGADGMIQYTWGPGNGYHQDNWLLEQSQLDSVKIPRLCEMLGDTFCVYGDPIFRQSEYLQKGFERIDIMDWQVVFNKAMDAARVSIEHIFSSGVTMSSAPTSPAASAALVYSATVATARAAAPPKLFCAHTLLSTSCVTRYVFLACAALPRPAALSSRINWYFWWRVV